MTVKFKVGDKIYEVTDQEAKKYDRCHVTWMNREVMDKIEQMNNHYLGNSIQIQNPSCKTLFLHILEKMHNKIKN